MMMSMKRWAMPLLVLVLFGLQGCATVQNADARDPWEPMNRSVYKFNDVVDNVAIKPLAQAYVTVIPSFVRTGVHNVLGNLSDVWSMANSALQPGLNHYFAKANPAAVAFSVLTASTAQTQSLAGLSSDQEAKSRMKCSVQRIRALLI